jgi:REP element-mobilizing transposase RayT
MINHQPTRKTNHLLIGRLSTPHARYFITICTKNKKRGLTDHQKVYQTILEAWRRLHCDKDIHFYCGTIMPDHIHFLFKLGTRLELSKTLTKFKSLTKPAFQEFLVTWQRNYHDHRLRADTALEGFVKYIYLNPYRKRLLTVTETYPHWHINKTYRPEFLEYLNEHGGPQHQWLNQPHSIQTLIENDLA